MRFSVCFFTFTVSLVMLGVFLGVTNLSATAQQPAMQTSTTNRRPEIQPILKGIEPLENGLYLLSEADDREGEATALYAIGNKYFLNGNQPKALEYYEKALNLFEDAGNNAGKAKTLDAVGSVYLFTGNPQKAIEYYEKALLLNTNVGDKAGEAKTKDAIGVVYAGVGNHQKAQECFEAALLLAEQSHDKAAEVAALNAIGVFYAGVGNPQKALGYCEKALPLAEQLGDQTRNATVQSTIGYVYSLTEHPEKALDYCEKALPLLTKAGHIAEKASTLNVIGYVYSMTGNPQKAWENYDQALAIEENIYPQINDPAQVSTIQDQQAGRLYAATALALLQLNHPDNALAMLERGRTNSLARLAGQNRLPLTALLGKDAPAWQEVNHRVNTFTQQAQKMKERLEFAHAVQDKEKEKTFSQQFETLDQQKRRAEADRADMLTHLFREHQDFQRLFFGQKANYADLKTALAANGTDDTLFLEFAVVDDKRTLLFALSALSKEEPIFIEIPIGKQALADKIEKWRDSILQNSPDEPQQAQDLYAILLLPLEQKDILNPSQYRSLAIVADGLLLDLPFAALINSEGKRLVQCFAISTSFSLSMLTWPSAPRNASNNLLAIVNPLGPKPPLPRTEKQAREMLTAYRPADLLAGQEPTRIEVLRRFGRYQALHFGVHGQANSRNGLYSRLLLAGKEETDQELTAAEITEHSLAAQLAVLSACETMQGQKAGGEGLLSLAWAFRAAGCPSVVASQWKVDEAATVSLMRRFYRELHNPKTRKDTALQRAMLEVMQEPGHQAPYYWAAFQVIGKTDPLRLVAVSHTVHANIPKRLRSVKFR